MARVKARFLGSRVLKDGSLTGSLMFENLSPSDRYSLIDLEGEVYLTNEEPYKVGEDNALMVTKQLLHNFEKIVEAMVSIGVLNGVAIVDDGNVQIYGDKAEVDRNITALATDFISESDTNASEGTEEAGE